MRCDMVQYVPKDLGIWPMKQTIDYNTDLECVLDAVRKANSIQTWQDVCYACVDVHKFRLAQMFGVNIIVSMDHFAELVNLLEQGINLDRAHQDIYTQLGILYAKYKEIN
eukprot:1063995_1